MGFCWLEVSPFPKSQRYESINPSGSVALPINQTSKDALPLKGLADAEAVGGIRGMSFTVIVISSESVELPSVTAKCTPVYVPD